MSGKTVTLKRKKSGKFLESFWKVFGKKISPTLMSETKKPPNSWRLTLLINKGGVILYVLSHEKKHLIFFN